MGRTNGLFFDDEETKVWLVGGGTAYNPSGDMKIAICYDLYLTYSQLGHE